MRETPEQPVGGLVEMFGSAVAAALTEWAEGQGGRVRTPRRGWRASDNWSGAVVGHIVLETPRPNGLLGARKMIVKACAADEYANEAGRTAEARAANEDFARHHLVETPFGRYPVGDGRFLMFQELAGDPDRTVSLAELPADQTADACGTVMALVLAEWNDIRHPQVARSTVGDYLRMELRGAMDTAGWARPWADDAGLFDSGRDWLRTIENGPPEPNPVRMTLPESGFAHLEIEYIEGLSHGDLHTRNALLPYRPPGPAAFAEVRLIDLADFSGAAPLTRDLAALLLSAVQQRVRRELDVAEADELIDHVLEPRSTSPSQVPPALAETIRRVHDAAGPLPASWHNDWRDQLLLSVLARALMYTGYESPGPHGRWWYFRLAAAAAARFQASRPGETPPVDPGCALAAPPEESGSLSSSVRSPSASSGTDDQEPRADDRRASVEEYLSTLAAQLDRSLGWHPEGGIGALFAPRKVKLVIRPSGATSADRLHLRRRQPVRGDVEWDEAVELLPVGVVFGDAGYGKSWLLRHHAGAVCRRAAHELGSKPAADWRLPLWLHAADLAACWRSDGLPLRALAAAARIAARPRPGRPGFDGLLAELLADGVRPHIMVDAYDEVFDDNSRDALAEALSWLADFVRARPGAQLLITSRPVGYVDPFSRNRSGPQVQYLALGALDPVQVEELWDDWFARKGLPPPVDRLAPLTRYGSALRDDVRVPLIAALCAWVAEEEEVSSSRVGLFEQVIDRFIGLHWKQGDRSPEGGGHRRDRVRQSQVRQALTQLAWYMAAGRDVWRDAVDDEECERQLASAGLPAPPDRSRTEDLLAVHGILVRLGELGELGGRQDGRRVAWAHPSMHQYLAARTLLRLPPEELDRWIDHGRLQPEWAETLRFALELEARDEQR